MSGVDGEVRALVEWDPDGVGPQKPVLVLGGGFFGAGQFESRYATIWDGTIYQRFASPPSAPVVALATVGADLYASIGPLPNQPNAYSVVRWTGSTWEVLGANFDREIRSMTSHNGRLVVGGWFHRVGNLDVRGVAMWDTTGWSSLAGGFQNVGSGSLGVNSLASYGGRLFAGGLFSQPASEAITTGSLAEWSGVRWNAVSGAPFGGVVDCMTIHDGNLVMGGSFTFTAGVPPVAFNRIAIFDGATWTNVLHGQQLMPGERVRGLTSTTGELSALTLPSHPQITTWMATGGSRQTYWSSSDRWEATHCIATFGGTVIVGGRVRDECVLRNISAIDGTTWKPLGSGVADGAPRAIGVFENRLLFYAANLNPVPYQVGGLAMWDGATLEFGAYLSGLRYFEIDGILHTELDTQPSVFRLMHGQWEFIGPYFGGGVSAPSSDVGPLWRMRFSTPEVLEIIHPWGTETLPGPFPDIHQWYKLYYLEGNYYALQNRSEQVPATRLRRFVDGAWLPVPVPPTPTSYVQALHWWGGSLVAAGGSYIGKLVESNWEDLSLPAGTSPCEVNRVFTYNGRLVALSSSGPSTPCAAMWRIGTVWQPLPDGYGEAARYGCVHRGELVLGCVDPIYVARFLSSQPTPSPRSPIIRRWVEGPPTFVNRSSDVTVCPGSPVRLSVKASGFGLTYAWFRDSSPVASTETPELLLPSPTPADSGDYACTVTNDCGSISIDPIRIRIAPSPCPCGAADVAQIGGRVQPDGQLSPDDIVVFLSSFFVNDVTVADIVGPGGSPPRDGAVTPDDIIAFLSAFFAGCS